MPIYGESIIEDDCFIDSDALIGYPHSKELEKESIEIAGCEIGAGSIIRPGSVSVSYTHLTLPTKRIV